MANDSSGPDAIPAQGTTGGDATTAQSPWAPPAAVAPQQPVPPLSGPSAAGAPPFGPPPLGVPSFGPPPAGPPRFGPPAFGAAWPPPPPPAPRRSPGLGVVVLVALVAALVGGAVGGVVGRQSAGGSGALGAPLPTSDASGASLGPVESVAERVLPSVVQLRVDSPGASGEGSGMVLSADGLLLTNNHVVEAAGAGGTVVAVFQDGRTAPVRLVGRDPSSDIAVLRAQGVSGLTPIALGNSDSVRVGQQVVAFGSPLGLGGTVTSGIVSALDRAVSVGGDVTGGQASASTVLNALQTDAAINPGNSGGPLVNTQAQVIGINSAIATTGAEGGSIGVGFSIPINEARRIAQELESTGHATRTVLGASVTTGGQELTGAVLGAITPDGPAAKAGIRQGQTVSRVDNRMIAGGKELVAAIREHAPGDRVTLLVDGRDVVVTLAGATN